jgi:hypothetical protein
MKIFIIPTVRPRAAHEPREALWGAAHGIGKANFGRMGFFFFKNASLMAKKDPQKGSLFLSDAGGIS